MPLPKIDQPIHSIKLPTSEKLHNFRPFLVKEEKILLMAKESGEDTDIIKAVKQVVNNCCLDNNFNVNDITITDLNYIFIRLRAISVDNKIKQTYMDHEDEKEYTFEINLDNIKIVKDNEVDNKIHIGKNLILVMKHPTSDIIESSNPKEPYLYIGKCIDKIFEGDKMHDPKGYTKEDLATFVDQLSVETLMKMNEFINSTPRVEYVIEYKNSLGNERKIVLNTLDDFFIFR